MRITSSREPRLWMMGMLMIMMATLTGCGIWKGSMSHHPSGTTPIFDEMKSQLITLERADGSRLQITAKIADNLAKQAAGFQKISPEIIKKSAILFVFKEPIESFFHMHNVEAPLDIAFMDSDGHFIDIETMQMGPTLYGPDQPFQFALEIRAGFFAENKFSMKGSKMLLLPLNPK